VARRHGADLRTGEAVLDWSASPRGVAVRTEAGRYEAARLVVCAGAWLRQLVPQMAAAVSVYPQVVYWFEIRTGYERLREMPVFIWDFGGEREGVVHLDGFYGFPAVDGPDGGLKLGAESYAETTVPDGRQHPAGPGEIAAMYADYVADRLPWLGPRAVRTVSCLYTSAAQCRFLIDRHPDHETVLIVSACSGHGFKHSPAIGEAVTGWVTGEPAATGIDLRPFSLTP
jgi:sarcosine oxidase